MSLHPLIPVTRRVVGGATVQAVNARDLHTFLEVATAFKDWITRRIEDFGFTEGTDFCSFLSESLGGRPAKEYALTLGMAKELAMVERNEKGKQARLYFIECERLALLGAAGYRIPETRAEALRLAADLDDQVRTLSCKVEAQAQDIAVLEPKAEFCDRVARAAGEHSVNEAAKILGSGQNRLFQWLESKGYLYRAGRELLPYQQHVDAGLFRVVEHRYEDAHQRDRVHAKVLVTGKGLVAIQRRMAADAPGALIRPQHQAGRA